MALFSIDKYTQDALTGDTVMFANLESLCRYLHGETVEDLEAGTIPGGGDAP
jgi:hypothetical protein